MRNYESGATRDTDEGKLDYEGFLCPFVLERYAQYMNKNMVQSDGDLRDSDNWQKGIPITDYFKSKVRHQIETWKMWRGGDKTDEEIEDSLCAEIFNASGLLHELLKKKRDR